MSEKEQVDEQVNCTEQVEEDCCSTDMKIRSNITRLRNRVKTLLKKPQPVQRSEEWFKNRNTLITASEAASCLTLSKNVCERYAKLYKLDNFKYNDSKCANVYEKQEEYIVKKCKAFFGEKVFHDSVYTLWGKKYEQIAVNLYKKLKKTDVYDFGLLKHPYLKWLGASPDGITPDGVMLEIKCPYSRKIKNTQPPFHYYCQVQIQLEVGLLESADFMECEIKEVDTLEEYLAIGNKNNTITTDTESENETEVSEQTEELTVELTVELPVELPVESPTESLVESPIEEVPVEEKEIPKGIVINLVNEPDSSEQKYIYQDTSNTLDPVDWAKTVAETLEPGSYQLLYYYIPNFNILNIKRDRVWFNNVKDDIKRVHDKVIYYQNNKEEFLKYMEEINSVKNKKHIEAFNNSVCLI